MNMFLQNIFTDEESKGWLPWGILAPFLAFAILAGALVGGGAVLKPFGLVDNAHNHIGPIGLFAKLITSFGIAGLLTTLWIKRIEKRSLSSVGMNTNQPIRTFAGGHLIGIAMMATIILVIWLLGGYEIDMIAPAFSDPTSLRYIFLLLLGFGIQSSVEELIFRGWLLSVLTRKFNLLTGVIASSALFTLMHFNPVNPWYDNILFMIFSLFACAWVIRTGNIWGVMGWHAGWNWFTATGFELPITGLETETPALLIQLKPVGDRMLHGGNTGPEGSLVCMIALAIGALYLMRPKLAS